MSQTKAKFINLDPQSFDLNQRDVVTPLIDPNGGLVKTATGLGVANGVGRLTRGALDPAGATIALPTAGGAETTVRNGDDLEAFDQYLVVSDGTVGGLVVNAGDFLVIDGSALPPTADGDFILVNGEAAAAQAAAFTTEQFTVDAATKTSGVFTLSGTPIQPTQTILNVAGAPAQTYTTDFTVNNADLTITAGLLALLDVGDVLTVEWK